MFNPDPVRGREQGNVRPGVIVSSDGLNHSDRGLTVIIPMTRVERRRDEFPLHVPVEPDITGLPHVSYIMCEQVRSIPLERLYGRRPRGSVDRHTMDAIARSLNLLFDL